MHNQIRKIPADILVKVSEMKNNNNSENSSLIVHLIKSCENYDLTEKESIETINKILNKKHLQKNILQL